jgi:hypothetical protein
LREIFFERNAFFIVKRPICSSGVNDTTNFLLPFWYVDVFNDADKLEFSKEGVTSIENPFLFSGSTKDIVKRLFPSLTSCL